MGFLSRLAEKLRGSVASDLPPIPSASLPYEGRATWRQLVVNGFRPVRQLMPEPRPRNRRERRALASRLRRSENK